MFGDARRSLREVAPNQPQSISSKNPRLASADQARSGYPQKFFYCQKSRLRVRAMTI
jgi:hypothetical protein